MADPYASFSSPAAPATDPYAAFARPASAAGGPSAGGVQDWEPEGYTGGQKTARAAGLFAQGNTDSIVGTALAPADLSGWIMRKLGLVAENTPPISSAYKQAVDDVASVPLRIRDAVQRGTVDPLFAPRDAYPTRLEPLDRGEKIAHATGEATGNALAVMAPAGVVANAAKPGTATEGVANVLASRPKTQIALAGAGGAVTGATDNPYLGLATALGLGATSAGIGMIGRGARNAVSPNVDENAARIVARAIERDRTTGNAIAEAQRDLGPGALLVEAGGPNVRGTMRGSIAAPGEGRTAAQDAFDARISGSNARTTEALDKSVSPNGSLASTVDELATIRRQQATPAYEAAGIPRRPESRITAIDEPPTWNTRQVTSPALEKLVQDSPDIRRALNTLRRFPDYKDVPANSMSMWDEAYKILGGMEREAKQGGLDRKAMLLGDLRRDYQKALVDANPDYQKALNAYSGPSKLIDAGESAKAWFTKNVDPKVVTAEFQAMRPAEQEAARVGVRDWARTVIGRSDRGVAAERVWAGGDNRARLEAILGPDEFATLEKSMGVEKNAIKAARDINVGSRTAPMLNEQADNALADTGILADLLTGHPLRAAGKFSGRAVDRIAEGKTEAVNAKIAELLTSTDPEKVGLVAALLERSRREELARIGGRRNALITGGVLQPSRNAIAEGRDR